MYGQPRGGRGGRGRPPGRGGFAGPGHILGGSTATSGAMVRSPGGGGGMILQDYSNAVSNAMHVNDHSHFNQLIRGQHQAMNIRENQWRAAESSMLENENQHATELAQITADQDLARNRDLTDQQTRFLAQQIQAREIRNAGFNAARTEYLDGQDRQIAMRRESDQRIQAEQKQQQFKEQLRKSQRDAAHQQEMEELEQRTKAATLESQKWDDLSNALAHEDNERLMTRAAKLQEALARRKAEGPSSGRPFDHSNSGPATQRFLAALSGRPAVAAAPPAPPAPQRMIEGPPAPSDQSHGPAPSPAGMSAEEQSKWVAEYIASIGGEVVFPEATQGPADGAAGSDS